MLRRFGIVKLPQQEIKRQNLLILKLDVTKVGVGSIYQKNIFIKEKFIQV